MTSRLPDEDDLPPDDLLAAEYVLGVQDLQTRATLDLRIRREPQFAATVAAWETRLGGLNNGYVEVAAPDLLPQIEARLFPRPAVAAARRFTWVRLVGGAGAAVALALVAVFGILPMTAPRVPVLTTLAAADLAYQVRADGETFSVTRISGDPAPAGQVHEFWVIAPGASPVSLGLLAEAPLQVRYPMPPEGWALAVSVEPAGGSPSGVPTGPVIMTALIGG